MAEVRILIRGYARESMLGMRASSTTTLIRDNGLNIVVDPGANPEMLLKALKKEKLRPKDVDIVFLTHYHPDHVLCIRLFPGKDILDGDIIYRDDEEIGFSDVIPGTSIRVIPTPGHAHEHVSLLVDTRKGKVAIAGDLFWWMDNERQAVEYKSLITKKDPYVKDSKALLKSRKMILGMADYVIPGHGKVFKVKKRR